MNIKGSLRIIFGEKMVCERKDFRKGTTLSRAVEHQKDARALASEGFEIK
jgi:hypothetical protein